MAQTNRRELSQNPGDAGAHARPLNVLLVRSDEHNPFFSSVYGHPYLRTPNMERLARRGTLFDSHYCASPLCMPARSAFMTGRYVHDIQCYSNCNVFLFDYPTYGGVLREQGIHTVHAGKTDVHTTSDRLGFSELLVPWNRPRPGDRHISRHPLAIRTGDGQARARGYGPVPGNPYAGADRVVDAAVEWLTRTAPSLATPWTLDVNIDPPHFPHLVTQADWDLYPEGGDLPRHGREAAPANHPYALDLRAHFETDGFTEEQTRGLRRGYLGCVTYVDRQLGRLLAAAEEAGVLDDTVVVYTSDHGEMLGKFGLWWKCSLYEDSARVPLIIAGPGFAAGARSTTACNQLDLQATVCRAVGGRRPAEWPGEPLQDLPLADDARATFSEYHGHGTRASAYLIRRGRWKLIWYAAAPHQLFDLAADPEELENLAETRPDVVRELEAELRAICDPEAENRRADEFIERQLAAIREWDARH